MPRVQDCRVLIPTSQLGAFGPGKIVLDNHNNVKEVVVVVMEEKAEEVVGKTCGFSLLSV